MTSRSRQKLDLQYQKDIKEVKQKRQNGSSPFSSSNSFEPMDKGLSSSFHVGRIPARVKLKLWLGTLFYHSSFSYEYAFDTAMEPIFWFVDHFTHLLGPAFVVIVIILVSAVVTIAHFVGLPFWYEKSPGITCALIVIGYWILVNLVFNFYKVATTSAGMPDDSDKLLKCTITICKKCISPKPPRTHHCSICGRCWLNMDHHCPWVNNCVGHFNRRYFLLTMVFIIVGCCFVMLFGVELAFREIIMDEAMLTDCRNMSAALKNLIVSNPERLVNVDELVNAIEENEGCNEDVAVLFLNVVLSRKAFRNTIYFAALLCIPASIALAGLTLWHAKLITMGETSIEYHINKAERKKSDQTFVNLYDLGKIRNWEVFLGLDQPGVSFFRHILLPSSHPPSGDGYDWSHITDESRRRRKRLENE